MIPSLTVYIDEAGDPGVRDGLKFLGQRHEWLCLGAIVVRTERDDDLIGWIKELRAEAKSTQSGALHYHRIGIDRRAGVCTKMATKSARAFVMASHKSNLREYINPRLCQMIDGGKMYNWCIRLLLERVTAWAEIWQRKELGRTEGLRVIFARRGHNWDHFFSYVEKLRWQSEHGKLFLKGPGLHPDLLDQPHWLLSHPEQYAGLQLADTLASAFYQAANTASPSYDVVPAQNLKPIVASMKGSEANCGVTVWPLPNQAPFPEDAKAIFEYYGYRL